MYSPIWLNWKKYLAIPTSSAAVSVLSIGGKIFRPERCRLSDMVFRQLMFYQVQWSFVTLTFV